MGLRQCLGLREHVENDENVLVPNLMETSMSTSPVQATKDRDQTVRQSARTKHHYNNIKNLTPSQRACGALYALKVTHNGWKRRLLEIYANDTDSLLDIACGRGGDIMKWNDCRIKMVHGVDISLYEVREAVRRASNIKRPYTTCTFQIHDFLMPYTPLLSFATVSTFFCLHYFCVSKYACQTLLESIERSLCVGGHWIGICLDSHKVTQWITEGKTSPHLTITNVSIGNSSHGFGQAYTYNLKETVTAPVSGDHGSLEYLVPWKQVVTMAEDVGLVCTYIKPCPVPESSYPGSEASEMCMAFSFTKLESCDDQWMTSA